MGKVSKQRSQKHTNHHDNPHRAKKSVVRRQHSQTTPKNVNFKTSSRPSQAESKPKNVKNNVPAKLKVPFSKWDQVLLVGEGDFSFALSLALNHPVAHVVATCFDSKDGLEQKYPAVVKTIRRLVKEDADANGHQEPQDDNFGKGEEVWNGFSPSVSDDDNSDDSFDGAEATLRTNCIVLYGIDATKLSTAHRKVLRPHAPFTKIVFNFPHVGGLSTDVNRQVRSNQQLLVNFFDAAKPLLATALAPAGHSETAQLEDEDYMDYDSDSNMDHIRHLEHGQILVTLFEGEPYTLWNIRDLARHSGLRVLESFKFPWTAYPGYQHARTIGDISSGKDRSGESKRGGAWRGEERDARCYILALKDDDAGQSASGSRKRRKHDDDSD